ncbi:MAG TPA: flippase activity-associated protein Agl23 [Terracidiphilus sp.]|nr:flippase activity-associated protein Agl23 [Terracidiphilus sp.]
MSWTRWPAFIVIALVGLAIRLPQLDVRPMHTDEAVNAYIVGQLLAGEPFTYDPQDRHGPALAALALPLARMQGARSFSDLTESELRLTSIVAGSIIILLFGAAVEMFGFVPSLLTALLFAVAPLPVYYDRYFIHEPLFCAATLGLILSAWYACKTHSTGQAMLAGACAAFMLACKETALLHLLALAAAALVFRVWNSQNTDSAKFPRPRHLLAALATFMALTVILFTWFGSNWKALSALTHVATDVLARAAGQGHQQPVWYYGQLLTGGWSGGLLFAFACVGLFIAIKKRDSSPYQWLAYYGLFLAAIYSLIPYKTPWLALNLWLPLAIFAGMTVVMLWRWTAGKFGKRAAIPAFCVLAFAGVLIGHDTRQRVFLQPADETNPYAYAHTSDDILGLPAEIEDMARRNGINSPRVAVIASDPWPLPWYLRHFNQVGFWQPGQQVPDADFYVTSTEAAEQYADRLRGFRPDFFGSRPGVLILLWLPEPK